MGTALHLQNSTGANYVIKPTLLSHLNCQNNLINYSLHDNVTKLLQMTYNSKREYPVFKRNRSQRGFAPEVFNKQMSCWSATILKGYSEIIAVTAPSIFIKSEIFAFW